MMPSHAIRLRMLGLLVAFGCGIGASLLADQVQADVPREPDPCDGRKAGDRCEIFGRCVAETCSRLVYGRAAAPPSADDLVEDSPGGGGPSTEHYECLRCSMTADAPADDAKPAKEGSTPEAETPKSGCAVQRVPSHQAPLVLLMLVFGVGLRRGVVGRGG